MKSICTAALCCAALQAAVTPPPFQPVFDAIFRNDLASLGKLVTGRDAANLKGDHENTVLMYACSFGTSAAVKSLLDAGADVNVANEFGATALMLATSEPSKVKLLLQHGANVNATTQLGRTALMVAASQPGSDAVVDMLLAKGADITVRDKDGLTFLLAAASCGNSRQTEIALARGVKPDT